MLFLKIKDKKIRERYIKEEYKILSEKFIFLNLLHNKFLNHKLFFSLYEHKRKYTKKSKIIQLCLLTNRSRSINKNLGYSRVILRNLFQFGIIPGYKKAVW